MSRLTNEQVLDIAENGSTEALYAETKRARTAEEMRGEVIAQAQAEIACLRAALKPFAEFGRVYVARANRSGESDSAPVAGVTEQVLTIGACRAALKALGEEG